MAEFIELQDEESFNDGNAEITNENPPEDNSQSLEQEEVIPEKYRGKTLEEIVKMHQEAEKLIGRQAQEVGETRKLADELIKQQLEARVKPSEEIKPVAQEFDFFDDPAKAVNQAVENNPVLKQMQEQLVRQKQMEALATIEKKHPDFVNVAQSSEFNEWIQGSKVRKQLYEAANNYDADAALELLDTYKSLKGIKEQTIQSADDGVKQISDQQRKQAIKAAGVQTGGTGESTKPTYRYADIMKLMTYDREQYNARADEFLEAYKEGRIKGRPN
jgi:hypothetical protein